MSQNTTDGSELWANRFKPSKIPELIGNGKCIADLRRWLGSW